MSSAGSLALSTPAGAPAPCLCSIREPIVGGPYLVSTLAPER